MPGTSYDRGSLVNMTSRQLRAAGSWSVTVQANNRVCHVSSRTLQYEITELRMVVHLAQRWMTKHGRGTFVDVGANCGVYSMVLAKTGHSGLAIDPLPACVDHIRVARQLNGFGDTVRVVRMGVSDEERNFTVPKDSCSPFYRLDVRKVPDDVSSSTATSAAARAVPLPQLLRPSANDPIMFMKLDTEGGEIRVLSSVATLLRARRVRAILWELSPRKWDAAGITLEAGMATLGSLFDEGRRYESFVVAQRSHRPAGCVVPETYGRMLCAKRGSHPKSIADQFPPWLRMPFIHLRNGTASFVNATWHHEANFLGRNILSLAVGPVLRSTSGSADFKSSLASR